MYRKIFIENNKEGDNLMCTCIKIKNNNLYFGRNLDLEHKFGEKVVITPRNYEFKLKNNQTFYSKYALIGMATVQNNYPLYAEAANEKGLCIAGLYFPENAVYNIEKENSINIASFELIPWILGNFSKISEIRHILKDVNITNKTFNEKMPAAELHWMISDDTDCIVLEQTKNGLEIYENPYEVLTNNPPFCYHSININNYMNISAKNAENRFSNKIRLEGYGQGMGMIGLPGDVSPTSRFIRAAFNKFNSSEGKNEDEDITQFFHILDSVSMIKGTIITKENNLDMTTYSCCINATKGIYYFKTYYNNQINAVRLNESNMNSKNLEIFEMLEEQNINFLN